MAIRIARNREAPAPQGTDQNACFLMMELECAAPDVWTTKHPNIFFNCDNMAV
jgi:hypothetical protein